MRMMIWRIHIYALLLLLILLLWASSPGYAFHLLLTKDYGSILRTSSDQQEQDHGADLLLQSTRPSQQHRPTNTKAFISENKMQQKSSIHNNRREFILSSVLGISSSLVVNGGEVGLRANAAATATSDENQQQLLQNRLQGNALTPPPYGLEGSDVFYPSWFGGTWNVASKTTDVQAPCGKALFGGNATYVAARNDIGETLRYTARFVPVPDGSVIADREYNVKSIAKAAMGTFSVVDIPLVSPNKFSIVLAPVGSPSFLKVDLIALNRLQQQDNNNHFDCSEVVREIVAPVSSSLSSSQQQSSPSPILKEVETISLYDYDADKQIVRCRQRSASYILPSQTNPMAMKMWQMSQGRPVDVRFYDVVYTKIQKQ